MLNRILPFLCCLLAAPAFAAGLWLPSVFSDNMVLQQEMPAPVWGKADPGERVTVLIDRYTSSVDAGADGKWRCDLPKMPAGGPYEMKVIAKQVIVIKNVLIGEVWCCSGQSNMQFPLKHANNAEQEIKAANYPAIRMFTTAQVVAGEPRDDVPGKWVVCSPATASDFSALGYFFGREIFTARKTSVGLLHPSCGWTPAEAWMPREALLSDPDFAYIVKRWDDNADPKAQEKYEQAMTDWKAACDKAAADGKPQPPKPLKPADPNFIHRASGLWNGAVAPLIPYAIRGVIWYQGETNEVRAYQYRKLFPALIAGWRKAWGEGNFPFLFMQVSTVLKPDPEPIPSEWAELREAQAMALAVPHTGMAVTVDLANLNEKGEYDVHPTNKQDAGLRLGLVARATVYGEKKLEYQGPTYKSMKVKDGGIVLTFTHADGLTARGDGIPHAFDIAGPDQKFVHAQAKIAGKTVVVWSDAVNNPAAVRYGWSNCPNTVNLYNKSGLPMVPFRTDTWPEKTRGFTSLTVDMF